MRYEDNYHLTEDMDEERLVEAFGDFCDGDFVDILSLDESAIIDPFITEEDEIYYPQNLFGTIIE